ncbi:hypothetical protein [Abyssalbus ytuae]|uniref:Right handed beta helix domain-containing protein n=1 Tax=Abyssalbus ytuae TaxID=2926907 RepID=A0A9E7CSW0_9FLAO|nr:hypothetical protein [Abyssalbus ytuae]UOB16946.1 hypothetical protein MQE35_14550 [Abyssalbus ytuae]
MRKSVLYIFITGIILTGLSCRKDFEFNPSSGNLTFSKDTVYLDTIFSNIGSSTYNLKVYNKSDEDIFIPSVALQQGLQSNYRLNVDGMAGKEFSNVEILAKDSIYIFIETTIDIENLTATETQFLYTDAIVFDTGSNEQKVELVTLVRDAVFLYPNKINGIKESLSLGMDNNGNEVFIEGFFLEDSELNFTNEKPYVIYGYAAVGNDKTLIIDPGARVHFHAGSGLIVANGASLKVNGELSDDPKLLEKEVIFEGDRLEPQYSNVPGQWGTIWLTDGSTGHEINHLTIKNATVGILMDNNDGTATPTLSIKNTQIYNSSNFGIWAKTAYVDAENLVIGNAGQASLYCNIGGRYNFKHCTFANYWTNSFRNLPAVLLDNYAQLADGSIFSENLEEANFINCIIYGNNNYEFLVDGTDGTELNYHLTNCLIKFDDFSNQFQDNPRYDFTNNQLFENIILNEDPDFKNYQKQEFIIGEDSAAINKANSDTAHEVPLDIVGTDRTSFPNIGAYQSVSFEEVE